MSKSADRSKLIAWTINGEGRVNASEMFETLVSVIEAHLRNHRIGDDPRSTARLIMAHLAHKHHVGPLERRA